MVAGITLKVCTKNRALDRSAYITDILGLPVVYLCDYFISGSSGTAMGGKGLIESRAFFSVSSDHYLGEGVVGCGV